jgi:hypothetical protein
VRRPHPACSGRIAARRDDGRATGGRAQSAQADFVLFQRRVSNPSGVSNPSISNPAGVSNPSNPSGRRLDVA